MVATFITIYIQTEVTCKKAKRKRKKERKKEKELYMANKISILFVLYFQRSFCCFLPCQFLLKQLYQNGQV